MANACRGCGREVVWARHERTDKVAPFVLPQDGMAPNVVIVDTIADPDNVYKYRIAKFGELATHINHFADCSEAETFRPKKAGSK